MSRSRVIVHGGTGQQGLPVVHRLLADGHDVVVPTRDPSRATVPQGATAVRADLLDTSALTGLYAGADAVLAQLPVEFDPARAVPQAQSVLDAVARSGVRRVVLNTNAGLPQAPVGVPFVDARALLVERLGDVAEEVTLVGPVAGYMENFVAPFSKSFVAQGVVKYPLPAEASVPWVTAEDVAAEVARAVAGDPPAGTRIVAGPELLTGHEVAERLGQALRRDVVFEQIDPDEYRRMLEPYLGALGAAGIAGSYAGPPPPPVDPQHVVRGSTTLLDWAGRQDWT